MAGDSCVDNLDNGKCVFGLWREGTKYDVVRYDEENEEWYIKDECGDTGVVDAEDFDEYFDKLEDDA